jgi:hypothetical protein
MLAWFHPRNGKPKLLRAMKVLFLLGSAISVAKEVICKRTALQIEEEVVRVAAEEDVDITVEAEVAVVVDVEEEVDTVVVVEQERLRKTRLLPSQENHMFGP